MVPLLDLGAGRACEPIPVADDPVLRPIGWVRSPLQDRATAPKQGFEGSPLAVIELEPWVADAARDLVTGSAMWVLTWFDRSDRSVLTTHPRDDRTQRELGVFATRSPDRPNPVGLHRVRLVAADGLRLEVEDLEALDGTPVLDLKPVLDGE
jgi:tRNA-Thr(GGU) m(6)t(6)A37 methyltransferase TsaA